MLKPYEELVQVDVLPFCDKRKAKDDNGKQIEVPYLNWAKCIELLHKYGAKDVWFRGVQNGSGSFLFPSWETADKNGRVTGCWFVTVETHIDDLVYFTDAPLMNGSLVVYKDTLNQLRINNCIARAFVKGVAIRTGLGFSLWAGDKDTDTDTAQDDLYFHNIYAIRERIQRKVTELLQRGMSMNDILAALKINKKQYDLVMNTFVNGITQIEDTLKKL